MSIIEEIKYQYRQNNVITKLIMINVAVFIVFKVLYVLFYMMSQPQMNIWLLSKLVLPAQLSAFFLQPWSIISYMFLHDGLFHLIFNMLWMYWLGGLFHEYLGNKRTLQAYFGGGIIGGFIYIIAFNVFPVFQQSLAGATAIGASAGVLALVMGAATLLPDYQLSLLLIGPVRLKYIALASVVLDLISIPMGNAGGHIAHLGGAAFGYLFVKYIQSNSPVVAQIDGFFSGIKKLFQPKPKLKITHRTTYIRVEDPSKPSQEEVDHLLDKISKGGYESLSKNEKEILFKASKN